MKLKNMFYAPIIIALAALAGCDNDDSGWSGPAHHPFP